MNRTSIIFLLLMFPGFTLLGAPPFPEFRSVEIDSEVEIGYGVAVADVNGNGKPDILLADKRQVFWYENPSWEKHLLIEGLSARDNVGIAARIIDDSGKASVAVGADWAPADTLNSGSLHYLEAPEDRTERWDAVDLPSDPVVHRLRWIRNRDGDYTLVVLPLHGRGNVQTQGAGVRVLSYGRPSDPRATWTVEEIDDTLHMTHNFEPVTWWSDGPAEDILVAAREGVFLQKLLRSDSFQEQA